MKTLHNVFDTYAADTIIAHNVKFDMSVLGMQLGRLDKGDVGADLVYKIENDYFSNTAYFPFYFEVLDEVSIVNNNFIW